MDPSDPLSDRISEAGSGPSPLTSETFTLDESGEGYAGRGQAWIAWIVILALVGVRVGSEFADPKKVGNDKGGSHDVSSVVEMQSRFLVGVRQLERRGGMSSPGKFFDESLKQLNQGDVEQRLRAIVIVGEIEGASQAQAALLELDAKLLLAAVQAGGRSLLTADQKRVRDVLSKVYQATRNEKDPRQEVSRADQELLKKHLGWFADVALTPQGVSTWQDRQNAVRKCERLVLFGGILVGIVGLWFLLGLCGLFSGFGFMAAGGLAHKFSEGHGAGKIYAETFALWLLMFAVIGTIAGMYPIPGLELAGQGLAMLGCLWLATLWPWLRGVPAFVIVRDIGLVRGRGVIVEAILGFVGYWMTLPFLFGGLIAMSILMSIAAAANPPLDPHSFQPMDYPSHPIVRYALGGNQMLLMQMVLLACVFAPVVEETMFRGFLYRHLREGTARWGMGVSILFSTLWNSLIFAAIHPQGWVAIPPLMGIAIGLTMIREWRNSLIPGMVAHGLNNGLVMTLLIAGAG